MVKRIIPVREFVSLKTYKKGNPGKGALEELYIVNFERVHDILTLFLKNDDLTRSDIAKNLGLKNKSGDFDPLTKSMGLLISMKLIEPTEMVRDGERGRPARLWQLCRNMETLSNIYELSKTNERWPDLIDTMKCSEWVYEVIIRERLKIDDEDSIEEITMMLQSSPNFFEICLTRKSVAEFIRRWLQRQDGFLEHNEYEKLIQDFEDADQTHPLRLGAYKRFFVFCFFVDKLEHKNTQEGQELVDQYEREVKGQ